MAIIRPFKALRPTKEVVGELASKPYDVLNRAEAMEEARNNPASFLHITKAEIDLPDTNADDLQKVYNKAKENLDFFVKNGYLFKDENPCYYIYRLTMEGQSQTGLVCVSATRDYFDNIIKKHELTRPDKEKDRIDHMLALNAQTGKVFMAYHHVPEIEEVLTVWKNNHLPEYNFTTKDDIQHTLWIVNDVETIDTLTKLFKEKVAATYIADGHHRAASAAAVSNALPQNENAQYFLTVIFPDNELKIMDYNRVVKDLNGLSTETFISAVQEDFEITRSFNPVKPEQAHEFGMYLKGQWYILRARPETYTMDSIGVLDVTILSKNILEKILDINDQRTNKRIDFVGGIRGVEELQKRVDSGEMQVAFSLYPVSIKQLFAIADSGATMPPKSTWFEPKLRDGLLTHLF